MNQPPFDALKLENQLCFPLYACSREIVKLYKPFLDPLDLTYTQYIVMMVLWEHREITSKELGRLLYLDSGTLTPLLKKLEAKGFISRGRSEEDERNLILRIAEQGERLKEAAAAVPMQLGKCINLEPEETAELYRLLYKILGRIGKGFSGRETTCDAH
ncbi:MAG: MarR family transcriptional regulator [Roseburia sp.]|nr:MarR family transcriptional regulator [Roseburia sp.]MCM1096595.1 MarR family transcriptional regulator [Ruminococcus flavefaciens]